MTAPTRWLLKDKKTARQELGYDALYRALVIVCLPRNEPDGWIDIVALVIGIIRHDLKHRHLIVWDLEIPALARDLSTHT
jgi:hypothetical protein